MPFPWALAGGLAAGGLSFIGSSKAADAQQSATDANAALQRELFGRMESRLQPFMGAGLSGLGAYTDRLGLGAANWDEQMKLLRDNKYGIVSDFRKHIGGNTAIEAYLEAGKRMGFEGTDFRDLTDDQILQGLTEGTDKYYTDYRSKLRGIDRQISDLGDRPVDDGGIPGQFTLEDLIIDPGYQFRLNEGLRNLDFAGAASGMRLGGGTLKSLIRYNQNQAEQGFTNAFNRNQIELGNLWGLAGMGQNSAAMQNTNATNFAQTMGNIIQGQGAANAASAMAPFNALATGLNTGMGMYTLGQLGTPGSKGTITPDDLRSALRPYNT